MKMYSPKKKHEKVNMVKGRDVETKNKLENLFRAPRNHFLIIIILHITNLPI